MKRAIFVCPGRGSYSRETLGMLKGIHSESLQALDEYRSETGGPTPSSLDQAERFSSQKHIAGDQASILTAACALADLDQTLRSHGGSLIFRKGDPVKVLTELFKVNYILI